MKTLQRAKSIEAFLTVCLFRFGLSGILGRLPETNATHQIQGLAHATSKLSHITWDAARQNSSSLVCCFLSKKRLCPQAILELPPLRRFPALCGVGGVRFSPTSRIKSPGKSPWIGLLVHGSTTGFYSAPVRAKPSFGRVALCLLQCLSVVFGLSLSGFVPVAMRERTRKQENLRTPVT